MNKVLEYKGYEGSVEYSLDDEILYGQVLGVRSLLLYEGQTLAQLKADFEDTVDDYLEGCKKDGVAPEQPFKGTFNIRMKPEEHRLVAITAINEGMSLNKFVVKTVLAACKA